MARRKHKTVVVRTVTVEFVHDSLSDGVPSERALRAALNEALADHEDDAGDAILDGGSVADIKTSTRRVPVEQG